MKLHKTAFGVASAIVMALCYTFDALFFGFAKELASKLYSNALLIKDPNFLYQLIGVDITKYLIGLAVWIVSAFILGWLLAYVYNMLIDRFDVRHHERDVRHHERYDRD